MTATIGALAWVFGGVALRLGGALVFWVALVGLATTGDPQAILVAVVGALAWLGGHGHHALRHGAAGSALAQTLLGAPVSLWHRCLRMAEARAATTGRVRPGGTTTSKHEPKANEGSTR